MYAKMTVFCIEKPEEEQVSTAMKLLRSPWTLTQALVNRLAGKKLGRVALAAQEIDFTAFQLTERVTLSTDKVPHEIREVCDHEGQPLDTDDLHHEIHTLVTYDGSPKSTLEIHHESQRALEPKYQKYMINFNCNFKCYEQIINELQTDARELQSNVIGFNYRNVSQSKCSAQPGVEGLDPRADVPKEFHDLLIDGIAQVQRLLDAGVSSGNITLCGLSIGGALATFTAQYFHQQGHPINLFNDRSFSTVTNLLISHVRTASKAHHTGHGETTGKIVAGAVLKPFVKTVLTLSKWEADAADAYEQLPDEYKEYMLVRTRKERRTAEVVDDAAIPHWSSLHHALKSKRRQHKAQIDRSLTTLDDDSIPPQREILKQARDALKDRKMEYEPSTDDAHTKPKSSLHSRKGESGEAFFKRFVNRAHTDHGINPNPPAPSHHLN